MSENAGYSIIKTFKEIFMNKVMTMMATLLVLGTAAWAQSPGTANGNAVFVGGTPIMRIRVGVDGYTPNQRARHIQTRVNQLLGTGPITPSEIQVQPLGNEATVTVKGQLLFTADWATARFNHTNPMALANEWAVHMRQVLPELTQPK
jgi:hypothetical protein